MTPAQQVTEKPPTLVQNYDCDQGTNCYIKKHLIDYYNLNALVPGHN